jgi:hypothetical protein
MVQAELFCLIPAGFGLTTSPGVHVEKGSWENDG